MEVVQSMQKCDVFAPCMKKNIPFHLCLRQGFASEEYLNGGSIPSVKKFGESIRWLIHFSTQNLKFSNILHK